MRLQLIICPTCDKPGRRNDRHDAYACLACDTWIERACSDDGCWYCQGRPERPADATWGGPDEVEG